MVKSMRIVSRISKDSSKINLAIKLPLKKLRNRKKKLRDSKLLSRQRKMNVSDYRKRRKMSSKLCLAVVRLQNLPSHNNHKKRRKILCSNI
jgi:hypothetical protein